MTSGSNCRHLKRPETEGVSRSIELAYQITPPKLQHFPWLGHASIETTNTYVEIDLEMKRKTLQSCEKLLPKKGKHGPSWQRKNDILSWLSALYLCAALRRGLPDCKRESRLKQGFRM
jgi:hypothetical protein